MRTFNKMKKYLVHEQHRDRWSNDPDWNGIVTEQELYDLAAGWSVGVDELLEQVEGIESEGTEHD